jgi:hypothetical protein
LEEALSVIDEEAIALPGGVSLLALARGDGGIAVSALEACCQVLRTHFGLA